MSPVEISRGLWLCDVVRRTQLSSGPIRALELGTGWTHFYGIFLRLFFEVDLVAFDVQDNRQFSALQRRFAALIPLLKNYVEDAETLRRAGSIGDEIAAAASFDDLYRRLGIRYLLRADGQLDDLASETFDLVFSIDVLEHIPREALETALASTARVLRPGGVSAHQIGLDDHLNHYVTNTASKQYIRYTDRTWRRWFENRLQYFNRAQMPDFERGFERAGLTLVEARTDEDPGLLDRLRPSPDFKHYKETDLQAVRGFVIHRKSR